MKKLFLVITLLLCTPVAHTAACLENDEVESLEMASPTTLEILPYIDVQRAQEILVSTRTQYHRSCTRSMYTGMYGRDITHETRNQEALFQQALLVSETLKSTAMRNIDKLKILLDSNHTSNHQYWVDCTKLIAHMIKKEAFNINDFDGKNTPLCTSVKQRDLEFTHYLLEQGAHVNKQENDILKKSALDYVINYLESKNHIHADHFNIYSQLLKLLIFFDANPDLPTFEPHTTRSNASYQTQLLIEQAEQEKAQLENQKHLMIADYLPASLSTLTLRYLHPLFKIALKK